MRKFWSSVFEDLWNYFFLYDKQLVGSLARLLWEDTYFKLYIFYPLGPAISYHLHNFNLFSETRMQLQRQLDKCRETQKRLEQAFSAGKINQKLMSFKF